MGIQGVVFAVSLVTLAICLGLGKLFDSSSILSFTALDTAKELEPGIWYTASAAVGLPPNAEAELYVSLPTSIRATSRSRSILTPSLRNTIFANSSAFCRTSDSSHFLLLSFIQK